MLTPQHVMKITKALADPTRFQILQAIAHTPTVCPAHDSASLLSYQGLPTSIQAWRGHSQEAKRGEAGRQRITRYLKR